jgi:antitoxin FitA
MPTVTLSVKNVPVDLAQRLKARAAQHHRSLQGELMALLEEAGRQLTIEDLAASASRIGLRTPAESARVAVRPGDVLRLARATGLTACAASYLWLARTRDAELVTLDGRLAKAAGQHV